MDLVTGRLSLLLALVATSCSAAPAPSPAAPAAPPSATSQERPSGAAAEPRADRVDRRTPVVRTVERVAPAVVNISTEALVRNPYYGNDSLFEWFFGQQAPRGSARYVQNSLGSGVIVDPAGYVVTNEHVVAAASRITVTFLDGRQVRARFVGLASDHDLAVLQLEEPGPYPFVSVDFRETLYPGETVIAIGNPFGLQSSVTTGILSGTQRRVASGGSDYTDFLQTDAAINPGNSGGALLTINGDLIGINTQVLAQGQNLGFAIPADRVRKVFDELVRYGEVTDIWLGADADAIEAGSEAARALAVPGGRGMFVRSVFGDSPAARAGLVAGDVILDVNGAPVRDYAEFHTALSRVRLGQTFSLTAWRQGRKDALSVEAQGFPIDRGASVAWQALGLKVALGDSPRGRVLFIAEVREGSRPDRVGLHRGLLVVGVDDQPVETVEGFYRALFERISRGSMVLDVSDGRATYRVPLPLSG